MKFSIVNPFVGTGSGTWGKLLLLALTLFVPVAEAGEGLGLRLGYWGVRYPVLGLQRTTFLTPELALRQHLDVLAPLGIYALGGSLLLFYPLSEDVRGVLEGADLKLVLGVGGEGILYPSRGSFGFHLVFGTSLDLRKPFRAFAEGVYFVEAGREFASFRLAGGLEVELGGR